METISQFRSQRNFSISRQGFWKKKLPNIRPIRIRWTTLDRMLTPYVWSNHIVIMTMLMCVPEISTPTAASVWMYSTLHCDDVSTHSFILFEYAFFSRLKRVWVWNKMLYQFAVLNSPIKALIIFCLLCVHIFNVFVISLLVSFSDRLHYVE